MSNVFALVKVWTIVHTLYFNTKILKLLIILNTLHGHYENISEIKVKFSGYFRKDCELE